MRRVPSALGILASVALLALLAYGLLAQAPDTSVDDQLARAAAPEAPGFELTVLETGVPGKRLAGRLDAVVRDRRIALQELRGTPVVLNFWASWCVPCQQEAPRLERAWRRAGGDGVLFLGLNMQDVRADAREFLQEFDVTYPNVREGGNEVAQRYGLTGLPETFLITARGKIVGHVIGVISPEQLTAGIAAARSGQPLPIQGGGDRRPLL